MRSGKIVDLRRRSASNPPQGQQPLFSARGAGGGRGPSLRSRRRKRRIFIALIILVLIGAGIWGVGYASYLPQFSVQTIEVTGAQAVEPQLVTTYVESLLHDGTHPFLSRSNIFLYSRENIEKDIVGYFPGIKSASLSRPSYLSTVLEVAITERQSFAIWCAGSEGLCYHMDEGGTIFAEAPESTSDNSGTQYVFFGGLSAASTTSPIGRTFVPAHLPGLLALLTFLGQAGFDARGVSIEGEQDFSIPLREGFTLKASFGADAQTLTGNLQLALSSDALKGREGDIEYIDLRFGNRIYYKFTGGSEVQAP